MKLSVKFIIPIEMEMEVDDDDYIQASEQSRSYFVREQIDDYLSLNLPDILDSALSMNTIKIIKDEI